MQYPSQMMRQGTMAIASSPSAIPSWPNLDVEQNSSIEALDKGEWPPH